MRKWHLPNNVLTSPNCRLLMALGRLWTSWKPILVKTQRTSISILSVQIPSLSISIRRWRRTISKPASVYCSIWECVPFLSIDHRFLTRSSKVYYETPSAAKKGQESLLRSIFDELTTLVQKVRLPTMEWVSWAWAIHRTSQLHPRHLPSKTWRLLYSFTRQNCSRITSNIRSKAPILSLPMCPMTIFTAWKVSSHTSTRIPHPSKKTFKHVL